MIEMSVMVLAFAGWTAVRLIRCDRCGVPQSVVRAVILAVGFGDDCRACRWLSEELLDLA